MSITSNNDYAVTPTPMIPSSAGMDIQTLMWVVQLNRANALNDNLKIQAMTVKKRNDEIAALNTLQSALNAAVNAFPPNTDSGKCLSDGMPGWGNPSPSDATVGSNYGQWTIERPINDALLKADMTDMFNWNGNGEITSQGWVGLPLKGVNYGTTLLEFQTAAGTVKNLIDQLNTDQQQDMLRLQALTDKENQSIEVLTNYEKKTDDNGSAIIGNMH